MGRRRVREDGGSADGRRLSVSSFVIAERVAGPVAAGTTLQPHDSTKGQQTVQVLPFSDPRQFRWIESDLVAHIGEVDHRRLYAREACPSMFEKLIAEIAPKLRRSHLRAR
jgi:hypothetical protein